MCELFAMSSRVETTVTISMETLARRGGDLGHLADGWGVGFYDGNDVRLFREAAAAGESTLARHIGSHSIRSGLVVGHLRHATQGEVSLRNTQPFARELGAHMHLFAHNGRLPGIEAQFDGQWSRFRPMGSTDSEVAFCVLLERMASLWSGPIPALADRLAVVSQFARELRTLGPANFLYADGDALFAHGHQRTQFDGRIAPPGLHTLARECAVDPDALAGSGVLLGASQTVTLFASVPLTQEPWRALGAGEIVVVRAGLTTYPS